MPGSSNGPAYGSRPKLVVMKVLCKLRWRKTRHPPIFPHSLSIFIQSLYSSHCFPVHFLLCSQSFLTRCVFLSISVPHILPSFFPLSVSISGSFSISVSLLHVHHSSPLYYKSICPSSAASFFLLLFFSLALLSHFLSLFNSIS